MSTTVEERIRPLMIEMDITVRTYDIDFAGHVSNIRYLNWMEDLRMEILAKHYPMTKLIAGGYQPIILSTFIKYKRAIKLFDKPKGYMWVSGFGKASYTFEGEIWVDGQLMTHVVHEGAFLDVATHRPRRVPPDFLEQYLAAKEGPAK